MADDYHIIIIGDYHIIIIGSVYLIADLLFRAALTRWWPFELSLQVGVGTWCDLMWDLVSEENP